MLFMELDFKAKKDEYFRLLEENHPGALDYYFEQLMNPVSDMFQEKVNLLMDEAKLKKYKYLIMPVGFSPEPLILWIRAFKPEKVFFITTPNTTEKINQIAQYAHLRFDQVKYYVVSSSDSTEIYEQIKNIIYLDKLENSLNEIAIDITGGKKSMVSGCTLAANYLGIDVLYVDYETYNPQFRKPQPGSELPTKLEDPLEVFGDRELERGIVKFNSGDFSSASEIFTTIKDRVINPRIYEVYEALSNGYQDLEGLRFNQACHNINKALTISDLIRSEKLPVLKLQKQLELIGSLLNFPYQDEKKILSDKKLFWHIYGFIFFIAKHHIIQKKLDHAALLIYRCLEMSVQYLLLKHGIFSSKANFDHLEEETEILLQKINKVGPKIYGQANYIPYSKLPKQITLMVGLQILTAIEEPLVKKLNLNKLLNNIEVRNRSILAHGFQTITFEDVDPFYKTVINQVSEQIWKLERKELGYEDHYETFQDFVESFAFVKL
jgi:CRISPR-associated protein (TIGR02710 family)